MPYINIDNIIITPNDKITELALPTKLTSEAVILLPIVPVSPLNTVIIIVIAIVSTKYCIIFIPNVLLSSSHAK